MMGPIGNYVVEKILLPPERSSEAHAKRAVKLVGNLLKSVDAHLEGRDYLAGEFSAADTLTGHACIVSARLGVDYSATPNVQAYVERLKARPALAKVLALRDA